MLSGTAQHGFCELGVLTHVSFAEKPTLDNLDTVLDKGCFNVAVVGKVGCGKSALVNALCGLNDHDRGRFQGHIYVGTLEKLQQS